jgi:DNA-binding CsgD family transcriptional regulator
MVFPEAQRYILIAQDSEYVSLLSYVVTLLLSVIAIKYLTRARPAKWLSVFPTLAGIGTVLMAVSPNFGQGIYPIIIASAAITGIGTSVLLNMWGGVLTRMQARYAPPRIALALLFSSVISLLLPLLPFAVFATISSLLPIASCVLMFISSNSGEFADSQKSDVSGETGKGEGQSYPWHLAVGLFSVGLPFGLLLGATFVRMNMGNEVPLICIAVNACISLVILVYLAIYNRNLGFSTIYRFVLPITSSGLLLIIAFQSQFIVYGLLLVRIGYALFDILIWLQLQKVFSKTGTVKMLGLSKLCLDGGVLAGLTLCRLVINQHPDILVYFVLGSAVLTLFTLPAVLTRRRIATSWFLSPASSKESEDFDAACKTIAESAHLTNREIEIMALIARGRNGTYIQDKLFISLSTFQSHSKNIYRKLGIHSRQELLTLFDATIGFCKGGKAAKSHDGNDG